MRNKLEWPPVSQRRRQGGGLARLPPCAGAQPLQIAGSALQDHLETREALFRGFHSQGLRPRGAERDSRGAGSRWQAVGTKDGTQSGFERNQPLKVSTVWGLVSAVGIEPTTY